LPAAGGEPQTLDVPFTKVAGISRGGNRALGLVDRDVVVARRDGSMRVVARDAAFPSWTR
jgi:hypothetical protein